MALKGFIPNFFSEPSCISSHRIILALSIKNIEYDSFMVDSQTRTIVNAEGEEVDFDEIAEKNPALSFPFYIDRDLHLVEPNVVLEYIEARYPTPPLLPEGPIRIAEVRQIMHFIDREISPKYEMLVDSQKRKRAGAANAKIFMGNYFKELSRRLLQNTWMQPDQMTVIDCALIPILVRLDPAILDLTPKDTQGIDRYLKDVSKTQWFKNSLNSENDNLVISVSN